MTVVQRVWFVSDETVAEHIDGEKRLDAREIERWLAELEQARYRIAALEAAMVEAGLDFGLPWKDNKEVDKTMTRFARALEIAKRVHTGQKYGQQDYIEHPIRVAEKLNYLTLKIIALLHDVVEDSDVTVEEIHKHFGSVIAEAVEAITRKDETYSDYIKRVTKNKLAREVKIADLLDNLEHIDKYPDWGFASLRPRYEAALRTLGYHSDPWADVRERLNRAEETEAAFPADDLDKFVSPGAQQATLDVRTLLTDTDALLAVVQVDLEQARSLWSEETNKWGFQRFLEHEARFDKRMKALAALPEHLKRA